MTSRNIKLILLFFSVTGFMILQWIDKDLHQRLDWLYIMVCVAFFGLSITNLYFAQKSYNRNPIFSAMAFCLIALCGFLLGDSIFVTAQYFINRDLPVDEVEKLYIDTTSDTSFSFNLLIIGVTILSLFAYVAPKLRK